MSKHKNTGIRRATHAGTADVQVWVISKERESQYHSVVYSEMKQKWGKKPEKDGVLDWILDKYVVNCAGNTQECNHCPNNSLTQAQRATDPNTYDLGLSSSFVIY